MIVEDLSRPPRHVGHIRLRKVAVWTPPPKSIGDDDMSPACSLSPSPFVCAYISRHISEPETTHSIRLGGEKNRATLRRPNDEQWTVRPYHSGLGCRCRCRCSRRPRLVRDLLNNQPTHHVCHVTVGADGDRRLTGRPVCNGVDKPQRIILIKPTVNPNGPTV